MKISTTTIAAGAALLTLSACASSPGPWRHLNKPVVAAPATCVSFKSSIYFDQRSAALTPEARMVLANARDQAKGCKVNSVRVTGLADAKGSPDASLELSKQRAETVSGALAKHGFGKVDFDLDAVGDAGAVTASGAAAPLRRRADIAFDLSPR